MHNRPLCVAAVFLCAGIFAIHSLELVKLPIVIFIAVIYMAIMLIVYRYKNTKNKLAHFFVLLNACAFVFGAYIMDVNASFVNTYIPDEGKEICLAGKIYKYEIKEKSCAVYLKNCVYTYDFQYQNKLKTDSDKSLCCIAYIKDIDSFQIGSTITISGKVNNLKEPSNQGQFNERAYYLGLGVHFKMFADNIISYNANENKRKNIMQIFNNIRNVLHEKISLITDESTAGIYQAMLLGEKGSVDETTKDLFTKGSIGHILVVSGLHFSIAGMAVFKLLRRRFKYLFSAVISCVVLFYFGILSGFAISALRAFIMFIVLMCAQIWGRDYDLATSLFTAVAVIVIKNPFSMFLPGFVLSVSAVLGIITVHPILLQLFSSKNKLINGMLSSFAISVISLPVMLYYYFNINPYSVVINAVVLPFMPFILAIGMIGAAISMISVRAAYIIVYPGRILLKCTMCICEICTKLPLYRIFPGKPLFIVCAVYYAVLAVVLLLFVKSKFFHGKKIFILMILLCGIFFVHRKSDLSITMLDVGQGQCIYLETSSGEHILYDGGSTDVSNVGKYRIIPFLQSRGAIKLDAVFISHLDDDHVNGIKEMIESDEILIKMLIMPETSLVDEAYIELENLAGQAGIEIRKFGKGDIITINKLIIEGLHPYEQYMTDDRNDTSIVVNLKYDDFKMLLCGDMEEDAMNTIISAGGFGDVDVLQVAHHGSKYTTSEQFLEIVKPEISLISCGENNRYGHPHKELTSRLRKYKSKIMCTMDMGAVTLEFK